MTTAGETGVPARLEVRASIRLFLSCFIVLSGIPAQGY